MDVDVDVFHRLGDWRLVVFRYEEPIAHLWGFFVPMKTGILPWGTSGPWGSISGPGKQHYTSTCQSLFGSQTGWQDGLVNKNIFISYNMGIFRDTLWWTNIAIENGHRNRGFSHKKMVDLSMAKCNSSPEGISPMHQWVCLKIVYPEKPNG